MNERKSKRVSVTLLSASSAGAPRELPVNQRKRFEELVNRCSVDSADRAFDYTDLSDGELEELWTLTLQMETLLA